MFMKIKLRLFPRRSTRVCALKLFGRDCDGIDKVR